MNLDDFQTFEGGSNIAAMYSEKDQTLVLLVDPAHDLGLSKSGKTTVIAKTDNWQNIFERGIYVSFLLCSKDSKWFENLQASIEKGVDIDAELGFNIGIFENRLLISLNCKNEFGKSKSGKSMTVATTEGFLRLKEVHMKIHAYRKFDSGVVPSQEDSEEKTTEELAPKRRKTTGSKQDETSLHVV